MSEQRQRCVIEYQVASYSGTEIVYCDENDEGRHVIEKCKRQLRQKSGPFPFGCESFIIVERENYDGE